MLPGRESLVHLVGKRRRYISAKSLLTLQDASSDITEMNSSDISSREADTHGTSNYNLDLERVYCPVCGCGIRGSDYTINAHLDACLSIGKKRRLTQCTLLRFNFSPGSHKKAHVAGSSDAEASIEHNGCDILSNSGIADNTSNLIAVENDECSFSEVDSACSAAGSREFSSALPRIKSNKVDHAQAAHTFEMLELDSHGNVTGVSTGVFDTRIVGRKFSDDVELKQGAKISILRDPENVKDPNAIKVLYMESGIEKKLGFLPRTVANCLSPLIEKYHMSFEGSITALPGCSHDAIPVQLVCRGITPDVGRTSGSRQVFGSLWENVIQVAESEKLIPLNRTAYQQNFYLMINEVLIRQAHLFTEDEKLFLGFFYSLSSDSQRLFVRIYSRKGPWFRLSSLCYSEISDPHKAIQELCESRYLCSFESINVLTKAEIQEVLRVLSSTEIREMSKKAFIKKIIHSAGKEELVEWLSSAYKDGTCPKLPEMISERTGTCVQISSFAESLLWRVQRLFFLNGEQDLTAFLLVDLGRIKYPSYTCNVLSPIFRDISSLTAFEEAIAVAQILDQSIDDTDMVISMKCLEISKYHISTDFSENMGTFQSRFSAVWVHSKVISLCVSVFECARRYKEAVQLLKKLLSRFRQDGRRGYWTFRLSIDLEHMGLLNESLVVAEEGVVDPWVRAGCRLALQRRVLRLGRPPRRWKKPAFAGSVNRKIREVLVTGRPLNSNTGMKNRFYGEDGEQCAVEQLALQYYAGEGGSWKGIHAESSIWMTIFGLLMWNVIFADVPDVFQNKFQTAPLDLETDCFYTSRMALIESHLERIYSGEAEEILVISWESHLGVACRGINWELCNLDELREIVYCIGGPRLASLCRHLAQDYRSWSSGMPDLLLWRFDEHQKGEVKLVEVKGPKDQLSDQQWSWLLLLMDWSFDVEVCKVRPLLSS